jgi:hypothetical protein
MMADQDSVAAPKSPAPDTQVASFNLTEQIMRSKLNRSFFDDDATLDAITPDEIIVLWYQCLPMTTTGHDIPWVLASSNPLRGR